MKKMKNEEELQWLSNAVDSELSDAFNYAASELYDQMGESWRRYFRQPYEVETAGDDSETHDKFSNWVSPMITTHVNDVRAFTTSQLFKNGKPIIKFRPKHPEDVKQAEDATEYVNYVFRNLLNGHKIVDELIFNAALLKICPVRVRMDKKITSEEMKFDYEGHSIDEFEEQLAMFFVANPELADMDADYIKEVGIKKPLEDGYIYACYKWTVEGMVEKHPTIDVINPGNFFVSRQAESLEEARMVAVMHSELLSDLATMYPEAPELNGFTSKKDKETFWEELLSGYYTWYNDEEWLSRWSYDSLGFQQQEDSIDTGDMGIGARRIFIVDSEVMVDPDDSGHYKLMHIVKAGNYVLHTQEISERSFMCTSFMPTAGRWLGLGIPDLVGQDAKEEAINTRAFTDATVQAAHTNLIVDPDQMQMDDVMNRGPDDILRRKENVMKPQIQAVEQLKFSGPDPSVLQAVQHFGNVGSTLTGVGVGFSGAKQDDISDMRLTDGTAQMISNKSELLLNYCSRNFFNFIGEVLNKLLNTAVKGNASPAIVSIADRWNELHPQNMEIRSDFIVMADIGSNDALEKQDKLNAMMSFLQAASGGGGQSPDGTPIPTIPVQLTPAAGYEVAKMFFDVNDLVGFEQIVVNPNIPDGQAQVMSFMDGIQQQLPQMVEQAIQGAMAQVEQTSENQLTLAKAAKLAAETEALMDVSDEKAFDTANKLDAEERREDTAAMEHASKQMEAETNRMKVEGDLEMRHRELVLQAKIADKATDAKATAVVSP